MADGFIPLAVPNLTGNERAYLNECIDTTYVSSVGPFVERLECDAAEVTGAAGAVATSAGTTALHTALLVCGVRPGDLVIVPSFTFIASANAVRHAGAYPWLMDISPETWCIDPGQVRCELESGCVMRNGQTFHVATGRRVSSIMPVYTLGNMPDMDGLRQIADEWNLRIVADAACAIGMTYEGGGLARLADLSCISLNGNKTVTAGGGGLIVGMDKALLGEAHHLTTTARVWPDYDFDRVGYNYRLTNLQAAVAVAQIERLDAFVSRKREVHKVYAEAFKDIPAVSPFPVSSPGESTCWFSGIVLDDEVSARSLVQQLNDEGVGARTFWKPVHLQSPYAACLRSKSLLTTEGLWGRIVTLPCSTGITDEELARVIETVRSALHA